MKKIIFEDTTVVKKPYIDINGVEYELQDGEYQGGTELNADTFNQLQTNVAEYIDGDTSMGSIIVEDIECKNMLNINDITYSYGSPTTSNNSVSIPWINGAVAEAEFNIIKNKYDAYTLSYNTNVAINRYFIKCLDSSGNILTNLSLSGFTYNGAYQGYYKDFNTSDVEDTFELPSTVSSFAIGFINNNSTGQSTMIYSNAQLEKGTIATEYIEHKDITYSKKSLLDLLFGMPNAEHSLGTSANVNNLYTEYGIKSYSIWGNMPKNMPTGAYAYGTLIIITNSLNFMFLNIQIYITDGVHTASSSTTDRGVYVRTGQANGWARLYGGNVGVTS